MQENVETGLTYYVSVKSKTLTLKVLEYGYFFLH